MLKLKNLNISKDGNKILNNLNIEINNGDVVAILGQNGQGKSSLLKAIMGYKNIFDIDGQISFEKKDISNLSINERSKLGLFYSWQDPIEIAGIKQIDFFRIIYQNKFQKINILNLHKTLEEILKKVELNQDFLERNINEGFSGGEKKKNEIIQMLLLDPKLIMLDEIDSGLDFDTTNTILQIIQNEIKNKKTILFISHNIETIKKLNPNRVLLLANNSIVKEGNIDLAIDVFKKGYKKVLLSLGIREKKNVMDVCVGEIFNEK